MARDAGAIARVMREASEIVYNMVQLDKQVVSAILGRVNPGPSLGLATREASYGASRGRATPFAIHALARCRAR